MGFDDRMLAEVGHGVEVEIERLAGKELLSGELRVPAGEEARDLLRGDARGIFRQEALLRHDIEAAEQSEPSSATSAMMWLLRSIDHSLSASAARSACAAGIMREPGSLAPCASA